MATPRDLLAAALSEQRPTVLVLGQSAWLGLDGNDATLAQALRKLSPTGDRAPTWPALLAKRLPPDFYEWLAERFAMRVPPTALTEIATLPWSAVFTSAIDQTLPQLFEGAGRSPEVVLTETENPRVARSTARPPVHYLFGCVGSPHPAERPPADRLELNTRRIQHAVPLLGRILQSATTLGVIAIDGFLQRPDWLRLDDLLGAIGPAASAQVLWFGGYPELPSTDSADMDAALESGRLLVDQDSLGTVVAELRTRGRLPAFVPSDSEARGTVTVAGGRVINTTPELRLRVEAVASIVDDSWTDFLPPLGPDASHSAFRRFHGNPDSARFMVEGIRRHFAIERDFEHRFHRLVSEALRDHSRAKLPIIVHGQSGTGKSVALARTVARVRTNKLAPVLYSLHRIPQVQEIASFCELADETGSSATLLVCDANRDIDAYYDLLASLRSRGRRVVLVGSQYRVTDSTEQYSASSTVAPVELSKNELAQLATLLKDYPDEASLVGGTTNSNILALLYRLLPSSRPRITSGLAAEARAVQRRLATRGRRVRQHVPSTLMAQELTRAGLVDSHGWFLTSQQDLALADHEVAGRIIDLVMVASSLHCPIPVNLLLRALTGSFPQLDFTAIAQLFRGLDILRWRWADSEHSELLVSSRLALEAQLICRRRLGGADAEAALLLELVGAARSGVDQAHELRFLLALLQEIGVDGPRGHYYRPAYSEVAHTLTKLRRQFGVYHPSLVLQESAFRRIAVRNEVVQRDARLPLLEEARDAVQRALDDIASGVLQASTATRRRLEVERASVYGFLSVGLADTGAPSADVWSSYEAARVAIRRAVSVNENYYPFDVGLWTPADLLATGDLTAEQRAELKADIYATLAQVDAEALAPGQAERFQTRRMKVGAALDDRDLNDEAFRALEASGSTAGYFLRARALAPSLTPRHDNADDPEYVDRAARAADFLKDRMNQIEEDERCLTLLLECRWIVELGRRPFRGNRQPLPATDPIRRELLTVLRSLNQASGDATRYVTRYLEAVLTWVVEGEQPGVQLFRALSDDTENGDPGRVVRRHVLADQAGQVLRFKGRVERRRSSGNWVVRVDGLNRRVRLLARDYPQEEIAYGRAIAGFAVAFNYIGPIADPIK